MRTKRQKQRDGRRTLEAVSFRRATVHRAASCSVARGDRGTCAISDARMISSFGMQLFDYTPPMMTGTGKYDSVEMGGMFAVIKIRPELRPTTTRTRRLRTSCPQRCLRMERRDAGDAPRAPDARGREATRANFQVTDARKATTHHQCCRGRLIALWPPLSVIGRLAALVRQAPNSRVSFLLLK